MTEKSSFAVFVPLPLTTEYSRNNVSVAIMKTNFKKIDLLVGWAIFAVAATVYLSTIEPTASLWDCGEFIALAYKMEIGHSPGAPFFMLVGNLFSQFASNPALVAKSINIMSALMSAFTILFLFWTITHLTRKMLVANGDTMPKAEKTHIFLIMSCGAIGALAYTFSDTFWFSAVEAEVYAFSSMLTALVFWLILKWEDNSEKQDSDKWLVLIAYVMGVSIGVHLLNLLCIPAICLVYYFKKAEKPNFKNAVVTLFISFGLIFLLLYGIVPGFTKMGGWFELFFVNRIGLSYNSGVYVYLTLLLATIVWTLFETLTARVNEKRAKTAFWFSFLLSGIFFTGNNFWFWLLLLVAGIVIIFRRTVLNIRVINLVSSCLLVFLIGCSVYALVPIRSNANPPLDLNSPKDVFSLRGYLNRDQYGQKPLLHGRTFASDVARKRDGSAIFKSKKQYVRLIKSSASEKDRYIVREIVDEYNYTQTMFFPRMYSGEKAHVHGYKRWGGITDESKAPTMLENIRFFINYQVNFMYWRYFMWNFSGRQNDIQGDGGITRGNWITGIPFVDNYVLGLGSQKDIAPDVVDNKGRNTYFMLPLLLGLLGIFHQVNRKKRGIQDFLVIFVLFFMTGLAIVLYINQTPYEPRERDYAYAGSFYAFCIWIGLGVSGISKLLGKIVKNRKLSVVIATLACSVVPLQMAVQNWDDHDRSGRTIARDMAMNFLNCVEPGGIIFTFGDNDTYPLWYLQEVEGFRTDVRVTNLTFLTTDWYIDQMRRPAYKSEALPITWTREQYSGEAGSHAYIITKQQIEKTLRDNAISPIHYGLYYDTESFRDTVSLSQALEKIKTGTSVPKNPYIDNSQVLPARVLSLSVDSSRINWHNLNANPTESMHINLENRQVLNKSELMVLELINSINNDNWNRPLYFATTVAPNLFMNLEDNFSLEGIVYRVTPNGEAQSVNTDVMYNNFMNKFRWGGIDKNSSVYFDEKNRGMITILRTYAARLIDSLMAEGENEKAVYVLDKCMASMPQKAMPYGMEGVSMGSAYYQLGLSDKAVALFDSMDYRLKQNLRWFGQLKPQQLADTAYEVYGNLEQLLTITSVYRKFDSVKFLENSLFLLENAQLYYISGLSYAGDFILQELMNETLQAYNEKQHSSGLNDNELEKSEELTLANKILELMQKYSPELLEKYARK